MAKNVVVQIPDARGTSRVENITLEPGATSRDLLTGLSLQDSYVVSLFGDDTMTFGLDEPLYDRVEEGAKLQVSDPANVGL